MADVNSPRRNSGVPPTGGRERPVEAASTPAANTPQREAPQRKGSPWFRPSILNVKLIYAAYLASLAIPFTAIVGAFYAYKARQQGPDSWLGTHYTYQMRTFWIGLAANIVAFTLSFVGVGLLLYPLIALWVVARSVKGLIRVAHRDPIEDPNSLFI